jgi:hypothetical protein
MTFHSLLDAFVNWCYNSPALSILRDTKLGIPAVQTLHLLGITTVLGTTVIMNMRLLGIGYLELKPYPFLPQVWRWFRRGLVLTLGAGFVVFLPDPVRYAANTSFRIKMIVLALAILFQFTVFRRIVLSQTPAPRSVRTVLVCAISLILWFGVGWCGRAIAFVG